MFFPSICFNLSTSGFSANAECRRLILNSCSYFLCLPSLFTYFFPLCLLFYLFLIPVLPLFDQVPPQMGQMGGVPVMAPQPMMYNQPVLRPTNPFAPMPGAQVSYPVFVHSYALNDTVATDESCVENVVKRVNVVCFWDHRSKMVSHQITSPYRNVRQTWVWQNWICDTVWLMLHGVFCLL